MRVSTEWLSDYIRLPKNISLACERLTHAGFEVEFISEKKLDTTFLRVAEILSKKSHPNADRLSVCDVRTKEKDYSIVCGAKNYEVGDKAILALPGAKLSNGLAIALSKIRGIESQGMLCSEDELGFSTEKSVGIIILPKHTLLKEDIKKVLDLENITFEVNVTPNRPDGLSMIGIARELAVQLGKSYSYPMIKFTEDSKRRTATQIHVKILDTKKCARYMCRIVENVKVGPSPVWLKKRLTAVGLRSVNNIVDVANYVMMELGQPIHTFDYDKIHDHKIYIRTAKSGEKMISLDGVERLLQPEDLIISDEKGAIAIAGVMGGASSEISGTTTQILIESAYFFPASVRRTSKRLGLLSESSRRFERGVDIEGIGRALDRVAQLIVKISGGNILKGAVDIYPKKVAPKKVTLRLKRLQHYLGYVANVKDVEETLRELEFRILFKTKEAYTVSVPICRVDVSLEEDLIEEVGRILGYDRIPTLLPPGTGHPKQRIVYPGTNIEGVVRDMFVNAGFSEAINYSFYSPEDIKKLAWTKPVMKIKNPIGTEYSILRPSLLPSLLKNVAFNIHHLVSRVKLFEIRNVYDEKGNIYKKCVGVMTGARHALNWGSPEVPIDFFDVKAVVMSLLRGLHVSEEDIVLKPVHDLEKIDLGYFQPGVAAHVFVKDHGIGSFGKIHPRLQEAYDIQPFLYVFEFDMRALEAVFQKKIHIHSISKYPPVRRDLSIVIPKGAVSYQTLVTEIRKIATPYLTEIILFDLYEGTSIPGGHIGYTFSLTFGSEERTLADVEINTLFDNFKEMLDRYKIKIR